MGERVIEANGVELCTEAFGEPADLPVLLIMGMGGSMVWWEDGFCRMLADGHEVGNRALRTVGNVLRTTVRQHDLCARFGGDYLQIPNTASGHDVYRRIAELHRQGCKINDIALAVGRSRRTVFRLLRKKITDLRRSG